jgi:transposase InsO family protein
MAESFSATLECELIDRRSWQTKHQARLAIFTWIESWYNSLRRRSGLGMRSHNSFEKSLSQQPPNTHIIKSNHLSPEVQTVR